MFYEFLVASQADVESQGKIGKAGKPKVDKANAVYRSAAGQKWWDATLTEWPEHDFRIFVGDMGNEVNDDILTKAFTKYASFQKARIVRDKHSNKSKGWLLFFMGTGFTCLHHFLFLRDWSQSCRLVHIYTRQHVHA